MLRNKSSRNRSTGSRRLAYVCFIFLMLSAEVTESTVEFIHIGKCGGSTVKAWLEMHNVKYTKTHLGAVKNLKAPLYIVWIRDPIDRFRSAFDYQLAVVNSEVSHLDASNITDKSTWCKIGPKCLAPFRLMRKAKHGYAYSKEFDELMLTFDTANELAEAITSQDVEKSIAARRLMMHDMEHIFKGIAYYLERGNFVSKYHDKMFVGRVEHQVEDLQRLEVRLELSQLQKPKQQQQQQQQLDIGIGGRESSSTSEINADKATNHQKAFLQVRKNPTPHKELSEKAIANLRAFYRREYATLRMLAKYRLIPVGLYGSDKYGWDK